MTNFPTHRPTGAAVLTDDVLEGVSEEVLATFELWMDSELEALTARWIHLAAPNASRSSRDRSSRRPSQPK